MYNDLNVNKFIVFKVADYLLGLALNDVLKVVNCSVTTSKRLTRVGLIQIGKHMIKILDLHQQLNSGSLPQLSENPPFLVITYDSQEELCGIMVDEPPDLVELGKESIRPFPKSERYDRPAIDIVSHVAVIDNKEDTKTIFLLDLKRLKTGSQKF